MRRLIVAAMLLGLWAMAAGQAAAQQGVWVQIEAQPTLREAEARARAYSGAFGNVAGFRMSTGWYAIALGPYDRATAEAELARLRSERLVPADSYINTGANFGQRFWPVGGAEAAQPAPAVPVAPAPTLPDAQAADTAQPPRALPEETPAEARRSEAALDRAGREALQAALQWQGYYTAAIDGAFGPGTRAAMSAWQAANGLAQTGVLTSAQRAALLDDVAAERAAIGLQPLRDAATGIAVEMPTALVAFDRYEPPFARFEPVDGSGVQVLLISQTGSAAGLAGLYEALQSLEIVPVTGDRALAATSFTLTGRSDGRRAHAEARLSGGLIKGFLLAWPAERDAQMARVLPAMQSSLTSTGDYALAPDEGTATEEQRRDLLAGLQIRRPERVLSGFFVSASGAVVTTPAAVDQCTRITLGEDTDMRLLASDAGAGVAVLVPATALAPLGHARLRTTPPRLQSEVAVAGYSFGTSLTLPVLTFGAVADLRGLGGEEGVRRLAMSVLPGDAGGPVIDSAGAVLGLLQPRAEGGAAGGGRVLPGDVNFATDAATIAAVLEANGIPVTRADGGNALPAEDLTTLAADITVPVACWN